MTKKVDKFINAFKSSLEEEGMVANAPGTKIFPGQLKKGLNLLAKGKAIDYEGATAVKFTDVGEHVGNFIEKEIKGGKFKNKKQR